VAGQVLYLENTKQVSGETYPKAMQLLASWHNTQQSVAGSEKYWCSL
jgi:hypothetical protein